MNKFECARKVKKVLEQLNLWIEVDLSADESIQNPYTHRMVHIMPAPGGVEGRGGGDVNAQRIMNALAEAGVTADDINEHRLGHMAKSGAGGVIDPVEIERAITMHENLYRRGQGRGTNER